MLTMAIDTNRLSLKPFTPEMATEKYAGWLRDSEVVRYSEQRHRRHSLETCRSFVASIDHERAHMWAILADREHIGNVTAHRDLPNNTADVGILIGERSAWGKGCGAEAYGAVTDWLLSNGCRMVTGGTMEANIGMIRVFEKCGFTIDGVRPGYFLLDGVPTGMVFASKAA